MPKPGHIWRHVIISTLNSWLPGDERGWRSRNHKRHCSGDYKSPPPPDEHAGLRRYAKSISGEPIIIPNDVRSIIGHTLVTFFQQQGYRVLTVSVGAMHAHLLVELPNDPAEAKCIVGDAKNLASRKVRKTLPGRIWAASGKFKPVRDRSHQRNSYGYIRDHILEGAWVWTVREGVVTLEVYHGSE